MQHEYVYIGVGVGVDETIGWLVWPLIIYYVDGYVGGKVSHLNNLWSMHI